MPSIIDIGLGKIGGNSHPVHPATVHLPLAFILTASLLDIFAYITLNSPALTHPIVSLFANPHTTSSVAILYHLSLLSYASTIAGILTAIPAVLTGAIEAYAMVSAKGLDLNNPVVKTTLIHAGLNDLAIFGAVYNWLSRRNRDDFVASGGNALVSAVMLGVVGYAAFLGGGLVYTHGTAVQRMGKGREEKEKSLEGEKKKAKKEL